MLKIIRSMKELDFGQLMNVYEESNRKHGSENNSRLTASEQRLLAEQDFYAYLCECFFTDKEAFYAVWAPEGWYVAALRLEPYRDGLLLEALETSPDTRGKGYATALVRQVLAYLHEQGSNKVYSHISKRNVASLTVHKACGFAKILDHAVFADGSVSHDSDTYCYQA